MNKIAIFHNLSEGGSVRVLKHIYDYLTNNHYQIDVYTTEEGGASWRNNMLPFSSHSTKINPWPSFIGRNLWILIKLPFIHKKIAKTINKQNYQAVLINHDYFTKSPYILRYINSKKIYILHEPQREYYEPKKYHAPLIKDKIANVLRYPIKLIDLFNTQKADLIIANSKYSQDIIKKVYKRESLLIYPGVNINLFKPSQKSNKEKLILLIGGLSRVKGHDFVIRSLYELLGNYKIIIVGNGREEDHEFIQHISSKKNKYISIVNHLKDKELVDLYQKASVLCVGAYKEPFGLTSIESQACGTPVVAVKGGGVGETIINGLNGFITDRSEKEFLEKTKLAIKNSKNIGKEGRKEVIKKWNYKKNYSVINKII
jgi:glycosyltransferase involved in cell wall biosynthesis